MSPSAKDALRRPITDPITGTSFVTDELDVIKEDLDVDEFILQLARFKKSKVDVRPAVTAADCELALDGAHQLSITVHDKDRALYTSGILDYAIDMEVRGWSWRLAGRRKSGRDITLVFEPRPVAWLRAERGRKKARRGKTTRAEFIRALVMAIKRGRIRFISPELGTTQPREKLDLPKRSNERDRRSNRQPGLDKGFRPSDGSSGKLSETAARNAERVLIVGEKKGARRKVQVAAMMTVYQESRFSTAATNGVHVGLFQQDPRYWPASRDPERDAAPFYDKLIAADRQNPNARLTSLIESVQGSGQPEAYAQWRTEAEQIVDHFYGASTGGSESISVTVVKPYEFRVKRGENWYRTATRLAEEVNWRLWTVRDDFHYQSETSLFDSKSLMTIKEGEGGIDIIDFDDDDRKPVTELTVTCRMRMWLAPVGTVVTVEDGGSADGRYLVSNISRSYFSQSGQVTLRKPTKPKLEPANETNQLTFGGGGAGLGSSSFSRGERIRGSRPGFPTTATTSVLPIHDTAGLTGYPAHDYMAPAGSPCVSPVDGKVCKISGSDPSNGPPQGPHGPFGLSVYISGGGSTYYLTHMGSRVVHVGQLVRQGEIIGTVGDYAKWGGANHIHMGVCVGGSCFGSCLSG
ncbi:MAG: M23 family metallopeptidase [Alphaproteobacteria bacterium]|nr:MAG: M23 family metallopeptidase [Alphaproteobacteria bacterium]